MNRLLKYFASFFDDGLLPYREINQVDFDLLVSPGTYGYGPLPKRGSFAKAPKRVNSGLDSTV